MLFPSEEGSFSWLEGYSSFARCIFDCWLSIILEFCLILHKDLTSVILGLGLRFIQFDFWFSVS